MNLKSYLKLFISYIIVSILVTFWVVTVFSTDLIFEPKIEIKDFLSENIFLDNNNLKQNYISFESNSNLSKYKLSSICKISSKFIWEKNNKYLFKFKYLDNCYNSTIFLETKEKIKLKKSFISLKLFNKSRLFDLYVDNDDFTLNKINKKLDISILKLSEIIENIKVKDFEYLKKKRKLEELQYHKSFLESILDSRNKKYIIPVSGYKLPTKTNKIPNTWRPYRKWYTDWIHHSWDIYTPFDEEVIALDDWKIIRIVNDWKWSDFSKLKYKNLSYEDKIRNLDILRWNQVWLKTTKWDVIFYGHLNKVYDFKEWQLVKRWEKFWTIWISWVPDKNYKNYHLDFSIQKNPYLKNKIWKYDFMDYMKWDWYFKWKSLNYVLNNQDSVFKK